MLQWFDCTVENEIRSCREREKTLRIFTIFGIFAIYGKYAHGVNGVVYALSGYCRVIPDLFIRARSVLGLRPRRSAAPFTPLMRQPVFRSA